MLGLNVDSGTLYIIDTMTLLHAEWGVPGLSEGTNLEPCCEDPHPEGQALQAPVEVWL